MHREMAPLPPLSPMKDDGTPLPRPHSKAISRTDYFAPGPVHLPGVDQSRNPILGTMTQYVRHTPQPNNMPQGTTGRHRSVCTRYTPPTTIPSDGGAKYRTNYHKVVHPGSMFEDTSPRRSYYIIAPDWTSEATGARRLAARQRNHYSWDSRPAFHPLHDYVIPLLERRRSCDSRLNEAIHSARESTSRSRRQGYLQAQTHASLKVFPPTVGREDPTARSLHNRDPRTERHAPTGSPFYKSMLASEVLIGPRRERTCPDIAHY
ncbi:hypothetical protein LSH36_540g00050 [Paralvinella palmiformis]|uniref:Uncharacterized protein n=1 Tax=Paralvinella palmiformis TaxID=53620 RepID=A0AAD9J8J8_9ANNE|nr:hypothetical protein LSH36_540g00050 [Paralvinella palmiformis]